MGYTREVIKGVSWTGFLRFITKAVGFLEAIILARILVPAQFGTYGIALLALGLLETLTETGVNIVLIQEKEIEPYISSAWFVSIGRGIIVSLILFLSSPLIATFFHSSSSQLLLQLISIAPFLRGFINPAVVKFQKELWFVKNFWYQLVILVVDTITSITVTYLTKQPIGIVIGLLVGVCIELLLSFLVVSPRPKFEFEKAYISKIFHRGKWITLSGIFDYLFFNSDNIAVGRMLGAGALGIYQLAYSLAVVPLTEIGSVFVFVTLPVFARLSRDNKRLQKAYAKTILGIFCLGIPYVFIIILFPHLFVLLLGQKWSAMMRVLPVLAVLGLVKSVSTSSSALFVGKEKQNYTMVVTLVTIAGMLLTIVPFIHMFGIVGAGFAALTGAVAAVPVIIFYTLKLFRSD